MITRRALLGAAGAATLPFDARAADGTLVVAINGSINTLDIHHPGGSLPSYQVAVNCYDRLISFGTRTMADGSVAWDYHKLRPELAESWTVAPDGRSITFILKPDATFADGSAVTAADVKWSFDRAIKMGGFPTNQMRAGHLENTEQFVVVDARTIRVDVPVASKLTLPDLAMPVAIVFNSTLAKAHATDSDPWASDWLHRNTAGSGAFRVERWEPGTMTVYARNPHWTGGVPPAMSRVIIREVANDATRRAMLERGDVQLDFDITGKDARDIAQAGTATVISNPIDNSQITLVTNMNFPPFQDRRVRQAIAWCLPYEQIFAQAGYGQGIRMFGGAPAVDDITWPRASPYSTDIERAKALLAQTDMKDGFDVTLSYDLSTAAWSEPAALLVREGLGRIGIRCNVEPVAAGGWRTLALVQKKVPLFLDSFGGWLNTPENYFYWTYAKGTFFNANYDNPEMTDLVIRTLDMSEVDPAYAPNVRRMISIVFDDVPRIPLWQPSLNSAVVKGLEGYQYWFYRGVDARSLTIS
jgi:peptide/nickel transport system substrate-binding protein